MEVVHIYSDEGKSGKSIEGRLQFQRMIDDIKSEKDNVNYILVFKLSRFGRNTADVLNTLEILEDYGVSLIAVEDGIDSSNGAGKLIIAVIAAVAEMERKNIIAQTTAGRLQKAREGKWNGGQAPIGYKINSETGILEIDEEYAGVIQIIFEKYANTNLGYTGIAEFLTKQGYTKRIYKGKEKELPYFSASTVKKIIDNPTYCGKIVYGRTKQEHSTGKTSRVMVEDYEIYPGLHKPIISEELFNSAQAKRKKTGKRSSRNVDYSSGHILSNVLVCPVCGGTLVGHSTRKKKRDGTYYAPYYNYECKHRRNVNGKPCTYRKIWNEKVLDAAVSEIIKNILKDGQFLEKMSKKINSQIDRDELEKEVRAEQNNLRNLIAQKDYLSDQIDALSPNDRSFQRKRADFEIRLNRLYDKIEESEELVEAANSRLQNLEKEMFNLKNVYKSLENFSNLYDRCSEEEKKKLSTL